LRNKKIFLLLLVIVFFLSGCGWWKDFWKSPERTRSTPEGLYARGTEAYKDGRYKRAIEAFQRLREEYPLHQMALLAELGIADSHFSDEAYADAELSYNDFINLHPTNENLPYAMYQLGMCHYKQVFSIDRDQTETIKAAKMFERLIARFPSSKFSFMAEKMLKECKQKLGEHEFYVGNFYFKKKQYKAALKRFEVIMKEYQNLGLDYQVAYFVGETKRRLAEEEARKAKEPKIKK
jgi:outer membrane protein assembly factor BamD